MKTLLLLVTCGLLLTPLAPAAEPFSHPETGITLPDKIAGLTRGEVTRYGDSPREGGVAIPYQSDEVEVTVFIRHIDPKKITSPAMIVEDTPATVKQMEATGAYANVKVYSSKDDSATPGWAKAAFTAKSGEAFVMSFIYAALKGEYAIKTRITTSNPKNESVTKLFGEFRRIVDEAKPKP